MSSRTEKSTSLSFILHHKPYQENSLILDVFTQQHGRIQLIAKGVKKSKKNTAYLLQPFSKLQITYLLRQNLSILTDVEKIPFEIESCADNKVLYCSYYLNELLIRLLPIQENFSDIFNLYQLSIQKLFTLSQFTSQHNNKMLQVELTLRQFELHLLNYLGYQISVDYDAESSLPISKHLNYSFVEHRGFVDTNIIKLNTMTEYPIIFSTISGNALLLLNNSDDSVFNTIELQQIKGLFRSLLSSYLGDKPLKTREIFQQLFHS